MANPHVLADTPHSYADQPNALVIAGSDSAARRVADALAQAGARLRARTGFADATGMLRAHQALDLIVIDATGASDALLDAALTETAHAARERPIAVVAVVETGQIDIAAMHLLGASAQLLCDPGSGELAAAIAIACADAARLARGGRVRAPMFDISREAEGARLQRLNEEVARIAEALARLTRGEEIERRPAVRAAGLDYRGGPPGEGSGIAAAEIRAVIRSRRLRAQFFATDLFADPAWDMLLDLFAAHLEHRQVSVSSLCIAAAVPPTTALRWIGTMHDTGLFERHADPNDRRRAYIALSAQGIEAMHAYATAAKRIGLGLV